MKKNNVSIPLVFLLILLVQTRAGAQCLASALVPYYEGFNSITQNNELPACWAASNMSVSCLTYTGTGGPGNKGAFYHNPAGVNYFYSRSLQLNAGITYSTTVWHAGSATGSNWTDLSLMYGPGQSPAGLTLVAGTGTAGTTMNYTSLTGTFTVASSGTYYMAIRGTGTSGTAQYLYFDDLTVTLPCSLNLPPVVITGASTLCSAYPLVLTASGADTYTWAGGVQTDTFTTTPNTTIPILATYSVTGTSTLSGCARTVTTQVNITPSPSITLTSDKPGNEVCSGKPVTLSVTCNNPPVIYSWPGAGQGTATITYTPQVSTVYSITATNVFNPCSITKTIAITVIPSPTLNAASSQPTICAGESATLTASGADTYSWIPNGISGSPWIGTSVAVSPTVETTYFMAGTYSASGCISSLFIVQYVSACPGFYKRSGTDDGLQVYPNPGSGKFTIDHNAVSVKAISVFDLIGRQIYATVSVGEEKTIIDLRDFSNGIYYVKILSAEQTTIIKVLKE